MHITRIQYPIGQGCFHVGSIQPSVTTEDSSQAFHYVYDCGSDDRDSLDTAIENYKNKTSRVDALFVSHLDRDHVNGIDQLCSAVKVDTVYVPHVNEEVLILELIQAELDGKLSASLVEASLEPEKFFKNKDVRRVIRVRSSPVGGVPEPRTNDNREEPDRTNTVDNTDATGGSSNIEIINSGTRIPCSPQGINWTLVPHVDPAQANNLNMFKSEVRKILKLKGKQSITSAKLLDAIRDSKERKCLRKCYNKIIPSGAKRMHNRVSMSLYSGPVSLKKKQFIEYRISCRSNIYTDGSLESGDKFLIGSLENRVGWIGSGDATLKVIKVRTAWKGTYSPYQNFIVSLLLPHHGSKHNFDSDVLNFPNLLLCTASAGYPSRHKHPSPSVEEEIAKQNKIFCHVSQFPQSALVEQIYCV